jgi:hypothetical protein
MTSKKSNSKPFESFANDASSVFLIQSKTISIQLSVCEQWAAVALLSGLYVVISQDPRSGSDISYHLSIKDDEVSVCWYVPSGDSAVLFQNYAHQIGDMLSSIKPINDFWQDEKMILALKQQMDVSMLHFQLASDDALVLSSAEISEQDEDNAIEAIGRASQQIEQLHKKIAAWWYVEWE